jgi:hypothetical protein
MFFISGTYIGGGCGEGGPREVESIGVGLAEAVEVEGPEGELALKGCNLLALGGVLPGVLDLYLESLLLLLS